MGHPFLLLLIGLPIPVLFLIWAFGGMTLASGCGPSGCTWAALGLHPRDRMAIR